MERWRERGRDGVGVGERERWGETRRGAEREGERELGLRGGEAERDIP